MKSDPRRRLAFTDPLTDPEVLACLDELNRLARGVDVIFIAEPEAAALIAAAMNVRDADSEPWDEPWWNDPINMT